MAYVPQKKCPAHQTDAYISQAAAVQNTWYTLLDTKRNVRIAYNTVAIDVAGEDLEVEWTIDGQTYTAAFSAVAGTLYHIYLAGDAQNPTWTIRSTTTPTAVIWAGGFWECRSLKVRVRKTTAVGAGTLVARMVYAKW